MTKIYLGAIDRSTLTNVYYTHRQQ